MKNRVSRALPGSTLLLISVVFLLHAGTVDSADRAYYSVAVLGDPHLPGRYLEAKERVIRTINSWDDVDLVVSLGDACENLGTDVEYAAVKRFFERLEKPLCAIAGNHDFLYADRTGVDGKRLRGSENSRKAKLRKFRETFGLPSTCYSRKAANYLLVFLSPENPAHFAAMSERQLDWLRSELELNRTAPTVVFFHAPLKGTLPGHDRLANTPDFAAQPSGEIHDILVSNPQVFLWVSGHTHTSPEERSFASAVNGYEGHVTNIHNTDMNRESIWTNSIFLYPDRVVVKTFSHAKGAWLPELERTVLPPRP